MADTTEVAREEQSKSPTVGDYTPVPPSASFGDFSAQIAQTLPEWKAASGRTVEAIEAKGKAMEPKIAAAEQAFAQPRPQPPAVPQLTPPPSRQLHDFLAPTGGESPQNAIMKAIQAVGLFATGIGGAAKGDARAGLAALTGAMKGWQEGDAMRADRAFSDWQAKTEAAIEQWRMEHQSYKDIMEATNLSLADKFRLVELEALKHDNTIISAQAAQQNIGDLMGFLNQQQNHADSVSYRLTQLLQMDAQHKENMRQRQEHEAAVERRHREDMLARAAQQDRQFAFHVQQWQTRQAEKADLERAEGGFTPQALDFIARQVVRGGEMPAMGMGKASTQARVKVWNDVARMAEESGITPEDQMARRQVVKATQTELNRLQSQRGLVLSFARTAEKNLEIALELSDKAGRTGVPVFNRWLQAGQRGVQGDTDLVAFDAATRTVINEYAKVTTGTTQGSDASRKEIADILNVAQTPEQFKAVVKVLRREMASREAGYDDQIKAAQGALTSAVKTSGPSKEPREVRVKRKSDGQTGVLKLKAGEGVPTEFEVLDK